MRYLFIFILISLNASSDFEKVDSKIMLLIEKIHVSGAIFVRAGVEYDSKKAASHIARKYKFAKISPLTPSKKDWTYEYFVSEIASKSSSSGEDYYIRIKDKKMKMKDWIGKQNLND